jgi:tRNA (cytidine/uridine-2'-O-)-methyltransferase
VLPPSSPLRLRASPLSPPVRVVLVEPEIPQNTGNIARLTAATASPLHLVGELGFRIDEHAVRRAGLDYWHLVELHRHDDFEGFVHLHGSPRPVLFSARASRSYLDAPYEPGVPLVFGRESRGLDQALLEQHADRVFAIPTLGAVRSLNLSNSVSIVLYEALRSLGALSATHLA